MIRQFLLPRKMTFYVPGMIRCDGFCSRYQAVSITGDACALQCEHCRGGLLQSMIPTTTPESLINKCLRLAEGGNHGVLISGGCDERGRLPWDRFLPAIREIKVRTGLLISIHSGLLSDATAHNLKEAGVDQALIDVVGDDETYRSICHVPFGISEIVSSLEALTSAGLEIVPHVVCGLHFGELRGETKAIEIISRFDVRQVVIVSVMKMKGRSQNRFVMPKAEAVAEVIAQARRVMPKVSISLGCARQRGNRKLETLAIDAGVNRMALPSEEAVERARSYGLEVKFQATCCSVSEDLSVDMPLTNGKGSRPAPEHIRSHSRAGGNPGGARGREPTLPRKLRGAPATRQSPGYRCGIMK